MNLLLTSAGLTNETIAQTLIESVGKPAKDITVGFIPTAANTETDQSWVQEDISNITQWGIEHIVQTDISILTKNEWVHNLENSDVIWLNGGNTYYLLDWVRTSGLQTELQNLLKDRVYVGSSAGSIITGPDLKVNEFFPSEESHRLDDITGLNYVSFAVLPHLNNSEFDEIVPERVAQFSQNVGYPIYALDDMSAVTVRDGEAHVISEGEWHVYNKKGE